MSRSMFVFHQRTVQRKNLEQPGNIKECVCSLDRLKPFTSYKFRMLATNDIGDSVISKETEAVTTLQDGEKLAVFA